MPFKVQVGSLTIEVDTEAELDIVVKKYAGSTPNGTRESVKIPSANQKEAIRKLIYSIDPRWTPQNRPFMDGSKPAIHG